MKNEKIITAEIISNNGLDKSMLNRKENGRSSSNIRSYLTYFKPKQVKGFRPIIMQFKGIIKIFW